DGGEHPHLEEAIATLHKKIERYDGPGNRSGAVLEKEVRDKMAKAKLGVKRKAFTEETKRKMSIAKSGVNNGCYGKKASVATRALLSKLSSEREAKKRAIRN